jgi:hypothetical protein
MGIFTCNKNEPVKSLNAKKIEVDLDNDDFFNSFEPIEKKQEPKNKFVAKLQEVNDPFEIKPSGFGMQKANSFSVGNNY